MDPLAPRRAPASQRLPLIAHDRPDAIAARRKGRTVSAAALLADIHRTAVSLPDRRHVLNVCSDRYHFAVLLCAAIIRGQVSLLPPATTPNVIRAMREFSPDAYFISDDPATQIDLPRFDLPVGDVELTRAFTVPQIDGEQVVACVFTSGSTGEPQPNFKKWGSLAVSIRNESARFGIGPGHAVLGTVPAQHMYGFESTVLLPLLSGATLTAERLYYPADIDAAIRRTPGPRTLFITPFHMRAWLESGESERIETVVSATAPLSAALARMAEERTGATLYEIYGCSEAGQIATRRTTQSPVWQAYEGLRLWTEGEQAMVFGGHVEQPTKLMDIIEVQNDGTRFLLHGRTADLVNIAGKRNSIGYLNHQLCTLPGVLDGAFYLPDDAERSEVGRLMAFAVAPGLTVTQVMAMLRRRIDATFMPRPLVLVERLPRELTGKLTREALRVLAGKARRGRTPECEAPRSFSGPQAWGDPLSVAPDHPAFAGHFPMRPVLPAVVVLTEVLAMMEAQTGRSLERWTIASAKFFAAIAPGESLTLSHTATPSGAIRFEVRSVRGVVASGILAPRHGS